MRRTRLPEIVNRSSLLDRMFSDLPEFLPLDGDDMIKVDEQREDDAIVIRADLPGVDPEKDIDITVQNGSLHLRAERQQESSAADKNMYRSELRYGSFSRVLPLPAGATDDDVKATYRDGVLEVRVPISGGASSTKIPITHG